MARIAVNNLTKDHVVPPHRVTLPNGVKGVLTYVGVQAISNSGVYEARYDLVVVPEKSDHPGYHRFASGDLISVFPPE